MWSRDAIDAAIKAYNERRGLRPAIIAALDAAVAVDGDARRNEAIDAAHDICVRQEQIDIAYGAKYPDEEKTQEIRAHRCRTLAAQIIELKRPQAPSPETYRAPPAAGYDGEDWPRRIAQTKEVAAREVERKNET